MAINTLNKTEARAACKKAGISYTNMTVADMRAALEAHELAHNEQGAAEAQPVNDHPSTADLPVEAEVVSEQRTDDAPVAPVVTTEPAAPVEAPKRAKVVDRKNGVTRPGKGKCLDVWTTLDSMKGRGVEITFELLRAAIPEDIASATIRTQRQRWKTYNAEKADGQ